ncbi:hypothetical protein GCM10027162_12610 [Streptomyces incanus]
MTRVSHSARAAVLEEKDGPFVWQDIEIDDPRPDEVLVRMVATGICATDAHVRRQQMPVRCRSSSVTRARGSWNASARRSPASNRATTWS